MDHHPLHLLDQWIQHKDSQHWVLGCVFHTQGSAYRKAGAMMLFSDLGQQLGLLSGGCLESDLQRQAMAVMQSGQDRQVEYNSQDEDGVVYQLGIGCGGVVHVMLQSLSADNDYLQLTALHQALKQGEPCVYGLSLPDQQPASAWLLPHAEAVAQGLYDSATPSFHSLGQLHEQNNRSWLVTSHRAPPHLAIFGAGVDARPLAQLALQLGWQVTLLDPRPTHARPSDFPPACQCIRGQPEQLRLPISQGQFDAAVVMFHQQDLDAQAIALLAQRPPRYCALLGPKHRREQILASAGVEAFASLAGPAGLALGAQLPEGIALAILAECHGALYGGDGRSLSGVLATAPER